MASIAQLMAACKTGKIGGHAEKAASGRVCLDIAVPEKVLPGGWMLLQGSLIRCGGDYDARLYYDLGEGFAEDRFFEVPASVKGVINEVICLPAGIRRMKFSPMGSAGEFELSGLTLKRTGAAERVWRMLRRVVAMLLLHPSRKRKLIRLDFLRMLVDLQGAYRAASRLRAYAPAPGYLDWIARFDVLGASDYRQIKEHIDHLARQPHFYLLLAADEAAQEVTRKTLDSLRDQIYRNFTCVVLGKDISAYDPGAGMDGSLRGVLRVEQDYAAAWLEQFNVLLRGRHANDWVMLLRAGDVLAPHALYRFACEALAKPEAVVLYSDDDALDAHGRRCQPRFKPDWSLAHLHSIDFVGNAAALRGGEVARAGGVNPECCWQGNYDLLLRIADVVGEALPSRTAHISAVLLHHGEGFSFTGKAQQWKMEALRAHLARSGAGEVSETLPGCWRVRYRLPEVPPLVSIVVPTRDAPDLIRRCMESLLKKTAYPHFEILVVDNQSAAPEVLDYLGQIAGSKRVRVLHYDLPFNYSAMNNMAVREARGCVVCLLNNDTEVISPDWLDEMVGHLLQPKAGVVGAKLYFPNGRVQHGGDLVGVGGVANHAHAFLQRDDPGYCNRAMVAQEFSAVTAACLVTWRSLYEELGGLNEKHLKVAFNDVDYCLRVREAGYRVVWTPHAELYHCESMSRGKDQSPEKVRRAKREAAYMRRRWKHVLQRDPFYNPNLSYERPDFSLSHAPMVERPWQA